MSAGARLMPQSRIYFCPNERLLCFIALEAIIVSDGAGDRASPEFLSSELSWEGVSNIYLSYPLPIHCWHSEMLARLMDTVENWRL